MKKAIALLATLVVLTSTTFAQLAPTMSGSAETKWGMDLDNNTNGFEVATDVTVTVPVVTESSKETEGEGATGSATITGTTLTFNFGLDNFNDDDGYLNFTDGDDATADDVINGSDSVMTGTDASISAKLDFANGAYMTIGADNGISASKVESADDDYDVAPDFGGEDGVSLGYASDAASFELTLKNEVRGYAGDDSEDSVDAVTAVTGSNVIKSVDAVDAEAGVDATYTTDDAVVLGVTGSFSAGDIFGISLAVGTTETASQATAAKFTGVAVEVTSTPVEGVSIAVPFDFYTQSTGTGMELRPTVDVAAGAFSFGLDFHYISVAAPLSLAGAAYDNSTVAVTVGYTLDAGALGVTLGTGLGDTASGDFDLTFAVDWTAAMYNVALDLGNLLGMDDIGFDFGVTPVDGFTASVETAISLDAAAGDYAAAFTLDKLNLDFGAALTGLENTVVTVNYSGFNADGAKGTFYAGCKISL